MTDLELLAAVEQASEEHDRWLASLGCDDVTGVSDTPHPFAGLGAPASEITQVLYYGLTQHQWWTEKMVAYGITSLTQLPFETSSRLVDRWLADPSRPTDTPSTQMKIVYRLRGAEANGLVARTNPGDGHAYWTLTELADAELRHEGAVT